MEKLLTEVCKIQYGFPFDSSKFNKREGMPLIRIRDISSGCTEAYTTEEFKDEYVVKKGDILIGMDGEFNIAKWSGEDAILNHRVCRLIPFNVDADYLYYFMPKVLKEIETKTSFVTVKHLSAKQLNGIVISLPTLERQKFVATVLQRTEKSIDKRKQQLQKLDELVKARFVEMVGDPVNNSLGWEEHYLDEYIEFLTSGSRGWAKYFVDNGSEIFITIKNVKNSHIVLDAIQYINAPDNKEAERTKVQNGDLLISITADLGRTGVVDAGIANIGAYINQHLSLIRLNKLEVNPMYVSYFLETEGGKKQFSSKNQSAVKAGLNFEAIKSLKIFMPPLELQNQFAEFVQQIDKSKLKVQKSLDKLETLKKALMQKYFG